MCGICGIMHYAGEKTIDREILKEMTDSMVHRGPDDSGSYLGWDAGRDRARLGLGHRRLSIIDLSAQGHQPMSNEDGTVWIVYNGEVYNFSSLKSDLIKKGHRFKSNTDTEVIVHLYEEEGKACVGKLRGMFAFAVWDEKKKNLFLARDRLGIKPLYYYFNDKTLIFASEIKSLLKSKEIIPEVNRAVLDAYLTFGFVPAPHTMFKNVYKLLPGHTLTYANERIVTEKYWDFDQIEQSPGRKESDYAREFMELLDECVKMRLISDVPLGVFLSGGLDSSTVVALMSRMAAGRVKTFSVGYKNKEANELEYARIVARKFNTEHHEFCLEPTDFYECIPKLIWHFDEPVVEAAAIPLYFISKLSRQHVTVLLSGEGADELLGGYSIYNRMRSMEQYRRLPLFLRNKVFDPLLLNFIASDKKKKKYSQWLNLPLEQRYLGVACELAHDFKNSLYSADFNNDGRSQKTFEYLSPYYEQVRNKDALTKMLYVDTKVWLPDDLLVKADKMTMATSVELRVPFLDYKLVEFAASIPSRFKIKNGVNKYLLKKAASRLLPPEVVYRKKQGFPVPIKAWFRGDFNEKIADVLLDPKSVQRGYFNKEHIVKMLAMHKQGRDELSKLLFSLTVLEIWHRVFIDSQ